MKEHIKILLISGTISVVLLSIFFTLHVNEMKILTLDDKWLLVSGIPILIGLFISGTIKNFKGFGIELETNLSKKIELSLVGKVDALDSPEITKDSMQLLTNMTNKQKNIIQRMQFIQGKQKYYNQGIVMQYLVAFKELKYIEIIDENKQFITLLPIRELKINNDYTSESIDNFIQRIENSTILSTFDSCISNAINHDDSLLIAYDKFKNTYQSNSLYNHILPVLDSNMKMIGTTNRCKITEEITSQVHKLNNK